MIFHLCIDIWTKPIQKISSKSYVTKCYIGYTNNKCIILHLMQSISFEKLRKVVKIGFIEVLTVQF